eukprot:TRINITY_DN45745_c0_g1_i1.p1 TRINITY_DN45745_c0_g1~~TRINITY_DN45745_c0_g1_i1.p1  ORF type:complete len:1002 (+),score=67.19 TRINITY_DN45745_c0_g1_i1:59-3064(+)
MGRGPSKRLRDASRCLRFLVGVQCPVRLLTVFREPPGLERGFCLQNASTTSSGISLLGLLDPSCSLGQSDVAHCMLTPATYVGEPCLDFSKEACYNCDELEPLVLLGLIGSKMRTDAASIVDVSRHSCGARDTTELRTSVSKNHPDTCVAPPVCKSEGESAHAQELLFQLNDLADAMCALEARKLDSAREHGRQRDVLPVPLLSYLPVPLTSLSVMETNAFVQAVNMTLRAINVLHGTCLADSVAAPTSAQRSVHTIAVLKLARMRHRLLTASFCTSPGAALLKVIGDSLGLCPDVDAPCQTHITAEAFDLLEKSGGVDPSKHLPSNVRQRLCSDPGIFASASTGLRSYPGVRASDMVEYCKLVALQIKSEKVCLLSDVKGGGTIFAVGKKGSSKKREVWHGGRVSLAAERPLKPPHLACPSALVDLETAANAPFMMSKRDGRCLFDQLSCPTNLVPYFGRPPIYLRDLMKTSGLTWTEVKAAYRGKAPLHSGLLVFPASLVWPMGFSWSSYIAQSTMIAVCRSAGLDESAMLAPDLPIPKRMDECFSLATDDVIHFATVRNTATSRMRRLDRAFASNHVLRHPDKDINAVTSGTCLGLDLDDGIYLAPSASSLGNLLTCCMHIIGSDTYFCMQPKQLASIVGLVQWFCLLNRPLFSSLWAVYEFCKRLPDYRAQVVPQEIKDELLLVVFLSPYFEADLTRTWQTDLLASDASPAYGFGLSAANVGAQAVRNLAVHAQRSACHVRFSDDEAGEVPRAGLQHRLSLRKSAFRTLLSVKATYKAHSGSLEAAAATLLLRWLTRSPERHRKRTAALVDATAVLHALSKGRSSAPTIRTEIARAGSIAVASDLLVRWIYVPSESNPADGPSRGIVSKATLLEHCDQHTQRRSDVSSRRRFGLERNAVARQQKNPRPLTSEDNGPSSCHVGGRGTLTFSSASSLHHVSPHEFIHPVAVTFRFCCSTSVMGDSGDSALSLCAGLLETESSVSSGAITVTLNVRERVS